MSQRPWWTSNWVLDRLQSAGSTPVVNPRRGAPDALWSDVPTEPGGRALVGYLVATVAILVFVALTWVATNQGAPTFIYEQF